MIMGESGTGKELVRPRAARLWQAAARHVRRRSTWRRYRRNSLKANSSAMSAARSPAQTNRGIGSLRAGRRRYVVPRRDRRHAAGGADPACCACCSKASTPRLAAARRSRPMSASSPRPIAICVSSSNRVSSAKTSTTGLNVVPMRLPPLRERAEDVSDLDAPFPAQGGERGASRQASRCRRARPAAPLPLARQCSRTGESHPPARRPALRRRDPAAAIATELREPARLADTEQGDEPASLSAAVERHLTKYFLAQGDKLPAPGLYDRILQEIERPLLSICLAATRGNQIRAAPSPGA